MILIIINIIYILQNLPMANAFQFTMAAPSPSFQQFSYSTSTSSAPSPSMTFSLQGNASASASSSSAAYSTMTIGPTANDYQQLDQRTHVYKISGMYIGSDVPTHREAWVYDFINKNILRTTIDVIPGIERLFLEILSNASDNVGRSRKLNVDPGYIAVTMDAKTITVTNGGVPIPVEMHSSGVYVPQMIFGSFLSGSNYVDNRTGAGVNGLGAKLTNVFSHKFSVTVFDSIRHLKYFQEWSSNLLVCNPPVITQYTGNISSVTLSYDLDFTRFKILEADAGGGYDAATFALFAYHAINTSFNAKVPVTFNGISFEYHDIREYARLFYGDIVDEGIVHYTWADPNTEVIKKKKGYQVAKNPAIIPAAECLFLDTPDAAKTVSFVNGIPTYDGGAHVSIALKAIGDHVVNMINESTLKRLSKQNKGKEIDAAIKRANTLTIKDVEPHVSIMLSVNVSNPKFTSQEKTKLSAPAAREQPLPAIDLTPEELTAIKRWQLTNRLYAAIEAKQFASMSKTDGKSRGFVKLLKGVDANYAGKNGKDRCVLYIMEGKSAAGYANTLISLIPNGKDTIGTFPMKGKSLNVMKANNIQIQGNEEIGELKKMLGLQEGMNYLDPANFASLRYGGGIMIMADSDVDGKHIIGLIINYFHCRFPSLLARGYIMYYRTPTLRVSKGSIVHKFYTHREYDEWIKVNNLDKAALKTWTHKYYKGLGTSKKTDVTDDFKSPRVVNCFYDADAPSAISLAFDDKLADQRKDWIMQWKEALDVDSINMQPISYFIRHELVLYSIANVERSIPKMMDGFKESQRKVMFGANKNWKIKIGKKGEKSYTSLKVAQFGAKVAEISEYQHGETILADVIIKMGQHFVGANNLPLFVDDGQFGSRVEGGKDASAARYLYTYPTSLLPYIFRSEDNPLLVPVIEEGHEVEPENYYPIIPLVLVNGAEGIGTGFSTFVPNHDPLDIITYIRDKLNKHDPEDMLNLLPWYRGFMGELYIVDRRAKKNRKGETMYKIQNVDNQRVIEEVNLPASTIESLEENDDDDSDEEAENISKRQYIYGRPLLSMVTLGKYEVLHNGTIRITELPIGKVPLAYRRMLEKWVEEKRISGFLDRSIENVVYFEIYGFVGEPSIRKLKLQKSYGMSNMVLLNSKNRPIRYDTTEDIANFFYKERLPIYEKRRQYIIQKLTDDITTLSHKARFVRAIVDGHIIVLRRKKADIKVDMEKLQIPTELLDTTKVANCTEDEIKDLHDQIAVKEAERNEFVTTTAEKMWLKELNDFETAYRKIYKIYKPGTEPKEDATTPTTNFTFSFGA